MAETQGGGGGGGCMPTRKPNLNRGGHIMPTNNFSPHPQIYRPSAFPGGGTLAPIAKPTQVQLLRTFS